MVDDADDGLVWLDDAVEGDSPADELEIGRERPPMRRRTKVTLAIVGVAAVAAAVAVSLTGGSDEPVAKPTPTRQRAEPLPDLASQSFTVVPAESPGPVFEVPGRSCDVISGSGLSCAINDRVPATLLTALRTVLPGAAVLPGSVTVTGPGIRVQSRHVTVRAHGRTVSIDILETGKRLPPSDAPPSHRTRIVVDNGDHSVTVTADAGTHTLPTRAALTRLAKDPRLLALDP